MARLGAVLRGLLLLQANSGRARAGRAQIRVDFQTGYPDISTRKFRVHDA